MSFFRRRLMLNKGESNVPNYLCFTALEEGTFTFTVFSNLGLAYFTYAAYSINNTNNWVTLNNVNNQDVSITTPTVNAGDKVYWKGKGTRLLGVVGTGDTNGVRFSSTCRFNASGKLSSLCNEKPIDEIVARIRAYGDIFGNCSTLIDASELILPKFTSGASAIFYGLFYNCTNLIKIPKLDNEITISDCYGEMFKGCTSLIEVDEDLLPATTLSSNCYGSMFKGCTSLTKAPKLPATNITGYREMFYGCLSLVNVPDIYVNDISGNYPLGYMFVNCTSLKHCPIKSVPDYVTVDCFREMFNGCTSLEDIMELPALTLAANCYSMLFTKSKVSYVKMLATDISASSCMFRWMRDVPNVSTSIFVKNINATWTNRDESSIPTNWTIIYYDPAIDKYYTD